MGFQGKVRAKIRLLTALGHIGGKGDAQLLKRNLGNKVTVAAVACELATSLPRMRRNAGQSEGKGRVLTASQ